MSKKKMIFSDLDNKKAKMATFLESIIETELHSNDVIVVKRNEIYHHENTDEAHHVSTFWIVDSKSSSWKNVTETDACEEFHRAGEEEKEILDGEKRLRETKETCRFDQDGNLVFCERVKIFEIGFSDRVETEELIETEEHD